MKTPYVALLLTFFASGAAFAYNVDPAIEAGFALPRACGGLQSPVLNIWGDVLVHRFSVMQKAEADIASAAKDAGAKIRSYAEFCPTYAQNMNSPTLLSEVRSRMKQAEDAATKVAKLNQSVKEAGIVLTSKYSAVFPDSACILAVPKDVTKADAINNDVMTAMGKAEQSCANASSNANSNK
ncbi:MAG: hypothetical protein ACXVB9_14895 [Bdellovibrionota bacterium]